MKNLGLKSLSNFKIIAVLGFIGSSLISICPSFAQSNITPDNSLGNEASQINENINIKGIPSTLVEGGAKRGQNLFHSFSEFNIDEGRGAYFLVPDNVIQNVLTRVTGNNPSNILGILGTISDRNFSPSNANLFLINPNGIVFGQNASLDLSGSFVGTTANAVGFGNTGLFSATNPQPSGLLTVAPSAFLFNQINKAASIQNNSVADVGLNPSTLFTPRGLRVADGKSLLLLGGDINFDGGGLVALGGKVELAGYSDIGTVNLNQDRNNLSLSFDDAVKKSDITLTNGAGVLVNAFGGGNIAINAGNLEITKQSQLLAGIAPGIDSPNIKAGNIDINITEAITLKNNSFIRNLVPPQTNGQGGDISAIAKKLELDSGGQIATITFGKGKGGNLTVDAREVQIIGGNNNSLFISGLGAFAEQDSSADAGNLTIKTDNLLVKDSAAVFSGTFGSGNGGKLTVDAEYIKITGRTKDGLISSTISTSALLNSSGNAGDLNIKTNVLVVEDGGQIITLSEKGKSGNLTVEAQDIQLIGETKNTTQPNILAATSGYDSKDDAGKINIKTNTLLVTNGAQINVSSFGDGNVGQIIIEAQDMRVIGQGERTFSALYASLDSQSAGNGNGLISIKTSSLLLKDGAQLNINTWGQGNAGKLVVEAKDIQIIGTSLPVESYDIKNSSGLFARSQNPSTGDGGEIIVKTDSLLLKDAGMISTNTFGPGKGGNVFIDAKNIEIIGKSFDNDYSSSISGLAQSEQSSGNGGDLTVRTDNLLIKDGGLITTESQGTGKAGNINLNVKNSLNLDNGEILTQAREAGGGNINVTVGKNIFFRNNSNIKTTLSTTTGSGGDINLSANAIVALEDSDILAFATEGSGGNITFNTRVFLSNPLYRLTSQTADRETLEALDGNNRVDINASGGVSAGTISGVLDANFLQDSLSELAENPIDSEALIASSCVVRSNQTNGTFFITGQSNLSYRPGDAISSQYSAVEVQRIKDDSEAAKPIIKWEIGQPVVEPSGIYRLANGKRILSRECGK